MCPRWRVSPASHKEGAILSSDSNFRLAERRRTWQDPGLVAPPIEETQARLAERRRAVAERWSRLEATIDARREAPYRELKAEVTPLTVMRPYAVGAEQPVVQALSAAVAEVTGKRPVATGMAASSDARWIFLDGRIPTVNFSFGNRSGHLPNEYVEIEGYIANIKAYALTNLLLLAA
jgi:acetylornithine deacetylase/succinyl-diaminopimelate desuccinylase-like protein